MYPKAPRMIEYTREDAYTKSQWEKVKGDTFVGTGMHCLTNYAIGRIQATMKFGFRREFCNCCGQEINKEEN